jgi:hypothetical protein
LSTWASTRHLLRDVEGGGAEREQWTVGMDTMTIAFYDKAGIEMLVEQIG